MALSGSSMGSDVWTAVKAVIPPAGTAISDAQGLAIWQAACTAIVAHIKTNMVVTVPLTAGTVGPGPAVGSSLVGNAANVVGSGVA